MPRHPQPAPGFRALSLVVLVALSSAAASQAVRPEGRFDDRVYRAAATEILLAPRPLEDLDPGDDLRAGWEAFRSRHGGAWTIYLDERTGLPALLKGRGIAWLEEQAAERASLEELESLARAFLEEHASLLGGWESVLELDREASALLPGGRRQLVFRQVVDGIRVEEARLDFHLVRGRLVLFGASFWGRPRLSEEPALDPEAARRRLESHLGVSLERLVEAAEPELVIVPLDASPAPGPSVWSGARGEGLDHALIWRLRIRDPGEAALWVGEIDAHDGTVLRFYDGSHYAAVRGGVFPIEASEDCPAGGCEIQGFPMPFADYSETGQTLDYADAYGNLQCVDGGADIESALAGPYVVVSDRCGELLEPGTCAGGADLGLKAGENCEVRPGSSAGNTAASRTSYYHVNRVAEAARFYDPDNTWLSSPVILRVNGSGSCNAFWNGDINMYGAGEGCANTGELQGILVHEWGHGYDHNDGGGADRPSEAYADIVSILYARQSCVSPGLYVDGSTCTGYGDTCLSCTGLRDHDWAARQSNTPATPASFATIYCPQDFSGFAGPCRREPHCEAYLTGEAIFDLATRDLPAEGLDQATAWQVAERLWYESRPGSGGDAYLCIASSAHSCDAGSWYQRMLVADDDDGDLSNGTPHAAALFAAFERHGLECGSASDPENQSSSSCPALEAPVLGAIEVAGGSELTWTAVSGAEGYRLYRGDLGCDRQQPGLAALGAGETSFLDTEGDPGLPRYYRVEAVGGNPVCRSPVSNCEVTPLGARLRQRGYRLLEEGEGNGVPEPGETFRIPLTLFNSGAETSASTAGTMRLIAPAEARLLEPNAAWRDIAPSHERESDTPHFEIVLQEQAACGGALLFEVESGASNAASGTVSYEIPLGDSSRDFLNDQAKPIPAGGPVPVTSTLLLDQDRTLEELDVSVEISHAEPTVLVVELRSPLGTTVRLHDQSAGTPDGLVVRYDLERQPDGPGSMADFVGQSALGEWTLSVQDTGVASPGGTLVSWTLHATVQGAFDCDTKVCAEPRPSEAPSLLVSKAVDGAEIDLVLDWSPVSAAGYHVLQSEAPAFDTGVDLIGRTAAETTWTIADGVTTTPDLSFFQARGVNSCSQEGP